MRSKASYFSISIPLIRENLRRLWAIPAIAFLVYFLSGVFPILMSYRNIDRMASYIEMSLHNLQPFYMGAHLLIPVFTAVVLFRYLQSPGSVAVMHSLPFDRSKLFNSNFLSGLLLSCGPVILNGLLLFAVSKPAMRTFGYAPDGSSAEAAVNVFTYGEIGNWMLTSLLIIVVLYSVAVFTAIVTGNSTVHLLVSYFFIFLIPILYAVFHVYFQQYLYGFDLSGDWVDVGLSISPYTSVLQGAGYFNIYEILFYLFTIVLMVVAAVVLYHKRKLERATDSLTFTFLKPVLSYIIAFLGMTLLGFYFRVLGEGDFYMYMGFAAGTIIFFIIGQMIVQKTIRIFNLKGLRNFLIYSVIAVIFLVGLNVDATGFERRVPDPGKVESAEFRSGFPSSFYEYMPYVDDRTGLKDEANIRALTEFHRSILENRERFTSPSGNQYMSSVRMAYDTGFPFRINRNYTIDYRFYAASPELKQIFESEEYKNARSLHNLGAQTFDRILVYSDEYRDAMPEIRNPQAVAELVAAIDKDLHLMTFEEFVSLRHKYARAELSYTIEGKTMNAVIQIPLSAVNTIQWLNAHGYFFGVTADMVEGINVFRANDMDSYYGWEKEMAMRETQDIAYPSSRTPILTVTDKDQIQLILDRYDSIQIDYDEAYFIEITYQPVILQGGLVGPQVLTGYLNDGLDFLD
ncbi:MAG: hypothetical protein CVU86_02645 [Firmicutes bacterium HGW-Firmicutes-11]|nr:MAG: hypothetical protein CVU86_02645 [Firmicutes bacterium HGW-Firmicutes-11]